MNRERFHDRREAGQLLAAKLTAHLHETSVLVLALPRGGVPVAFEVAKGLHAPLDVILVRKLGVPGRQELAMGALATGGIRVLNADVIEMHGIPDTVINEVTRHEYQELQRRERLYRGDRPPYDVRDRTVLLVDDGIATGATMHAAVAALQQQLPARLIIAVPVAASSTCDTFTAKGVKLVCILKPRLLFAIGSWYDDFSPTTDEEVRDLLEQAKSVQANTS
jgi:putative phosphoribosyl transferase